MSSTNWADEGTELPATQVIDNNDGTKTIISYRYNEQKKKVKVTQKIKFVKTIEKVNPLVAKRMKWAKFGAEKNNRNLGVDSMTTSIGEEAKLILSTTWKAAEEKEQELSKKTTAGKTIKCRVCGNSGHYTAKCPYRDTMGLNGVLKSSTEAAKSNSSIKPSGGSSYVPPNMRGLAAGGLPPAAEVPALRITNLNTSVDRDTLQSIVSRYGSYERVSILKNRETGEPLGVAFVNMTTLAGAEAVKEALDGKGLMNLILSVDWARPK